jgi:hypothetical protein
MRRPDSDGHVLFAVANTTVTMRAMSRCILSLVIVGVLLAVGCKGERDKICERAVDIAIECDAANVVGGRNRDEIRDHMLDICKEALADAPAGESETSRMIRQEVREYAECKAKAEGCEGYQRCEALLQQPGK